MASTDSPCPFERAEASVTCPIIFVPFGKIVLPSVDFTSSIVCAVTCCPGLAFFESTEESSLALITVPLARDASLLVVSDGGVDCAATPVAQNVASNNAIPKDFMEPPKVFYRVEAGIFGWKRLGLPLGISGVGRNIV
jgi:hypothetical protein